LTPDGEQGTGALTEPSVYILDTTLREGELNPSIYYTSGMLEALGLALARLGTPRIEYSVTYPQRGGSIRDLRNIISTLQGSYEDVVPVIQCRALAADIDIAQELGARGCGIYIAISQEHRRYKLNGISLEKVISRIEESLDLLKEYGFKYRRAVLEDASRFFTQYKGEEDTLGTFRTLIETADRAGATVVSIPDTAGIMDPTGASEMFRFASSVTKKELAAHFHNDYGNSLGNTLSVVGEGYAKEAHVSIYGLGSGVGIADHYEVSANLMDNMGMTTGQDRGYFKELYAIFQETTKIPIPWNHPLSDHARTEKAGTHQAQQLKSPGGYVPQKKLTHDFDNRIIFQAGRMMSRHLVQRLLEGLEVPREHADEIVKVISARSTVYNRKLNSPELKAIVKDVAGIDVSTTQISQYIGPDRAFYLLRVTPHLTTDITERIMEFEGVINVLETFGTFDIFVEANLEAEVQRRIEESFGQDILEIQPLIIG